MDLILTIILPVFGVVGLGWGAARIGYASRSAIDGLNEFTYWIAVPCLLFRAMSSLELSGFIEWRAIAAYFTAAFTVFALGDFLMRRVFKRAPDDQAILGFGCVFGNSVLLGIPLTLRAYGEAGAAAQAVLIGLHSPVLFTALALVISMKRAQGASFSRQMARAGRDISRNPIIWALGLGALVNVTGLVAPLALDAVIDTIGRAALPCALFAMGGALARYEIARGVPAAATVSAIKLLLMPAIVFGVSWLIGVDPFWRNVATLMSAMPCGVNVYIFANAYDAGPGAASSAIVISSVASLVTITVVLALLGVG